MVDYCAQGRPLRGASRPRRGLTRWWMRWWLDLALALLGVIAAALMVLPWLQ
jgi:hypothetical protein